MSTVKRVVMLVIGGVLTLSGIAAAQDRHNRDEKLGLRGDASSWRVLLRRPEFRGRHFCVKADDDLRKLPGDMRDRISSLRVIGDVSAVVFRDERFKGSSGRFLTDVRDVRRQGWKRSDFVNPGAEDRIAVGG